MVHRRRNRIWDVDRGYVTPEAAFMDRRAFLMASGLVGVGGAGLILSGALGNQDSADAELRATLKSVPGSAVRPAARNDKFTLDRPITDRLVAARYNNFYEFGLDKERCWREAQKLTVRPWSVEITGLVAKPMTLGIDDLVRMFALEERLYRLRCVERWAIAVPWLGFGFRALMDKVEPRSAATHVRFVSFHRPKEAVGQRPGSPWSWPYYEALTLAEAANELTFVAVGVYGHDLPRQHGAPIRMVVPWKYGYKSPKSVVKIEFVRERPRTFWNDSAPHEYGFFSNVNPDKPHPRWSQKEEVLIGTGERRATVVYNGYGAWVSDLYKGDEH